MTDAELKEHDAELLDQVMKKAELMSFSEHCRHYADYKQIITIETLKFIIERAKGAI